MDETNRPPAGPQQTPEELHRQSRFRQAVSVLAAVAPYLTGEERDRLRTALGSAETGAPFLFPRPPAVGDLPCGSVIATDEEVWIRDMHTAGLWVMSGGGVYYPWELQDRVRDGRAAILRNGDGR